MGSSSSRTSSSGLRYREATSADVADMERCRALDETAGPADARMVAYLDGQHHPRQALAPRTAFVALDGAAVAGYIAGHATTRYGCAGEVQYLYVAPQYRRAGVAGRLLQCLAQWFEGQGIRRVCVNADVDSAGAVPFYVARGASALNQYWYVWDDISSVREAKATMTLDRPDDAPTAFQSAWNAHDMTALAALFHHDATFVNRFGHYVRGVDAIVRLHEPIHETIYRDSTLENELIDVTSIATDAAVTHFWSRLRIGHAHPAGPHEVDTLILAVLTRRDDRWRIQALENVTLTNPRTGKAVLRDQSDKQ